MRSWMSPMRSWTSPLPSATVQSRQQGQRWSRLLLIDVMVQVRGVRPCQQVMESPPRDKADSGRRRSLVSQKQHINQPIGARLLNNLLIWSGNQARMRRRRRSYPSPPHPLMQQPPQQERGWQQQMSPRQQRRMVSRRRQQMEDVYHHNTSVNRHNGRPEECAFW